MSPPPAQVPSPPSHWCHPCAWVPSLLPQLRPEHPLTSLASELALGTVPSCHSVFSPRASAPGCLCPGARSSLLRPLPRRPSLLPACRPPRPNYPPAAAPCVPLHLSPPVHHAYRMLDLVVDCLETPQELRPTKAGLGLRAAALALAATVSEVFPPPAALSGLRGPSTLPGGGGPALTWFRPCCTWLLCAFLSRQSP